MRAVKGYKGKPEIYTDSCLMNNNVFSTSSFCRNFTYYASVLFMCYEQALPKENNVACKQQEVIQRGSGPQVLVQGNLKTTEKNVQNMPEPGRHPDLGYLDGVL